MQAARGGPKYLLVERLTDGTSRRIPLDGVAVIPAVAGARYALIDADTGAVPKGLVVKRLDQSLLIDAADLLQPVELTQFYAEPGVAFVPQGGVDGDALSASAITAATPAAATTASGEQVIWTAASDGISPLMWAGIGLGGLALAAAGGGGDDGPAPVVNTVTGTVVGGPVVTGNGLSVIVYAADGTTRLGEGKVAADGSFSIAIGRYIGVVIARVVDADTGADYLDEATGTGKDLNANLFTMNVVTQPNSSVVVNLNVLTTIAYLQAVADAAGAPLQAAAVLSTNQTIGQLFGVTELQATVVAPINGGSYNAGDGVSQGEVYGAVLAAFSGADVTNGGNSQQTIDEVRAGIAVGAGGATLSDAAQAVVVGGAQVTTAETGTDVTGGISVIVDTFAPVVTSGAVAATIAENSGAGQLVYTMAATDSGPVTYSLRSGGDAAAFVVDASTGAVTLAGNPDFEVKPGYSVTVVATDAAGNATEQAVTLAITNRDEGAPAFTSGGSAAALAENSGAGQTVYTAASTDASDVAVGSTVYSLKTGGDAAAFSINASTGAVTLTGNPDFEAKPSYAFTVVATDAAGNASERAVTLAVTNRDEVAPTFTSGATATAVSENSGAGQVVYTAASTDTGDVATGSTVYSLKAGGDAAAFTINGSTGAVTLTGNPDFETKPSYAFTVVATDVAGNAREQAVTLAINDLVDETAPTVASVAISSATGAQNTTLNAGDTVTVTVTMSEATVVTGAPRLALDIGGTTVQAAYVSGSGSTGLVFSYTVLAVQADANGIAIPANALQLNAGTVRDVAGNAAVLTHAAVGDNVNYRVDTASPAFTSGSVVADIAENSGASQTVYAAAATDTGAVTYSLKPGADAAAFTINASTGAVTLTGNPDYEAQTNYGFTVVATDAAGNQSEQALLLDITNADEAAPSITSGGTASAIAENSGAGQTVYTAASTDAGDVATGSTVYTLKVGGDTAAFTINGSTGAVTLTGNPDFETKPSYGFTVVATDAAGNASEQAVTLAITNVDEVAPNIASGGTASAIAENSGAGQTVYTAASTDAGDVATGSTVYTLKAGGDAASFSINGSTGAVTLTGNPDFETKPSHGFTVVATDAAGNASEQSVTLAITNLDEVAPSITSGATATAIAENSGAGQAVYTATSTDTGDVATGSTVYMLKAGGDAAAFSINGSTGVVTLTGNPDYETQPSYTFTVVATDAAGNASEQAVTLAIGDLSDETAPAVASVAISSATGAQNTTLNAGDVVNVTVTMDEATVVNTTGGTPRVALDIGGSTVYADYASGSGTTALVFSYTVLATQADGNGIAIPVNGLEANGGTLRDAAGNAAVLSHSAVADNASYRVDTTLPSITSGATASAVAENSGAGQTVYTAAATDAGALTYTLKAGGDAAAFTINGSTGAVTVTGNPDFETKPSYGFTVVATDAAGNASEQAVTLAITNLDEVAPSITSGGTASAIAENSGAGQTVYTAASTDAGDVATDSTVYTLKAGGDAAAFTINGSTGALTLTGNPDFETKPSYGFTVVATDAAGNASEQAVTLAITNVDEVAPSITSSGTASAIAENSGAGQTVYTAASTDAGDVATGSTVYTLKAGGDAASFSINGSNGAVTLTGNPDFETKPSYGFTVVATDAAGNATEQAVTLAINNVDEVAPSITSGGTASAIAENSGAGQTVYTAASTDAGDVATGSTVYTLKAGGDAAAFTINGSTGAVTLTGNPDFETKPSYGFTVVATDAAGNASEQAVTLAINNVDEVAPSITSGGTASAIAENSGAGQAVYTAASTDAGDVATGSTVYTLKAGGDAAAFTINGSTGAVTLTGNPDFETKPSYGFTVVATDAAGNASELAVTLAITNVDEVAPTVSSVAITSSSGALNSRLNAGDTVTATVTMNEATVVDATGGTPRLALNIGGTTVYANYASGSGSTALAFTYTLQAAQTDANGISIAANSIDVNGGTLRDAAGNNAVLTHSQVADNASYLVDTTAPTLSSSTPADDASAIAVGNSIVLNFSETVVAGSGNIVISNGVDTRTIAVGDGQVGISGSQVTINPTTDLQAGTTYNVQLASGVLTDQAGNAYGGIGNATTLNFDTAAALNPNIVVFDLLTGVSSDHSSRTFQAGVTYTIYIRVDSTSLNLDTTPPGGSTNTWGAWSGANNLGSDDRVVLVGSGAPVTNPTAGGSVNQYGAYTSVLQWVHNGSGIVQMLDNGSFTRYYGGGNGVDLWAGNAVAFQPGGLPLNNVYLTALPAGVMTSQGLL